MTCHLCLRTSTAHRTIAGFLLGLSLGACIVALAWHGERTTADQKYIGIANRAIVAAERWEGLAKTEHIHIALHEARDMANRCTEVTQQPAIDDAVKVMKAQKLATE